MRYDLKALVETRKGRVSLPPIEDRYGAVLDTHKALRVMLRGIRDETSASVLPRLRADRGLTLDAAEREWFRALRAAQRMLQAAAEQMVERILRREGERHTAAFAAGVKRRLGVDLAAVLTGEGLEGLMVARAMATASAISGLSESAVAGVEQIVTAASVNGTSLRTVRKQLTDKFGIEDRRAGRIARDQVASWNADLNELRQSEAGVTEYIWRSSKDERTRPLHKALEGRTFKWGKPTDAENGLPPGKPIMCRCTAEAVIVF